MLIPRFTARRWRANAALRWSGVARCEMTLRLAGRKPSPASARRSVRIAIAASERASGTRRRRRPDRTRETAHHPDRAEPVREPPGERARDEGAEPEEREDAARGRRRDAHVLREVEDQERQEHRPRPVHERGAASTQSARGRPARPCQGFSANLPGNCSRGRGYGGAHPTVAAPRCPPWIISRARRVVAQRRRPVLRRRPRRLAPRTAPRPRRADVAEGRLLAAGPVRRVPRPRRRPPEDRVRRARADRRREARPDARRRARDRAPPVRRGVRADGGRPVRLLHSGHRPEDEERPRREPGPDGRRDHDRSSTRTSAGAPGYVKIVDAFHAAARLRRGEALEPADESGRVGTSLDRYEAEELALGRAAVRRGPRLPGNAPRRRHALAARARPRRRDRHVPRGAPPGRDGDRDGEGRARDGASTASSSRTGPASWPRARRRTTSATSSRRWRPWTRARPAPRRRSST